MPFEQSYLLDTLEGVMSRKTMARMKSGHC
jgi:hypothetical protein